MLEENPAEPRGILNYKTGQTKFSLDRILSADDLRFFIENYWFVEWDLRGEAPYRQETLSHPTVHIVIQKGKTAIFGVVSGKFSIVLDDVGYAFGTKFRPGAFYPFINKPMSTFTDKTLPIEAVFGAQTQALEDIILALDTKEAQIAMMETLYREHLPEQDETVDLILEIADFIQSDTSVTRVDQLIAKFHLSKRTLQRIFNEYVGVSPKWMIQRYRLHEALEKLELQPAPDWKRVAVELGYFDQAHFINDFKKLTGQTPARYLDNAG